MTKQELTEKLETKMADRIKSGADFDLPPITFRDEATK